MTRLWTLIRGLFCYFLGVIGCWIPVGAALYSAGKMGIPFKKILKDEWKWWWWNVRSAAKEGF